MLVDEPQIKLGDLTFLHAKHSTSPICNASELTGIEVSSWPAADHFLQIMVHRHPSSAQAIELLLWCTLAATVCLVTLRG